MRLPNRNQSRRSHTRSFCSHKRRALLVPFALTGCTPDEALAFEAHLLECDACFEDLKSLDLAAAVIGDPEVARLALADAFYNPLPVSDSQPEERTIDTEPGENCASA